MLFEDLKKTISEVILDLKLGLFTANKPRMNDRSKKKRRD